MLPQGCQGNNTKIENLFIETFVMARQNISAWNTSSLCQFWLCDYRVFCQFSIRIQADCSFGIISSDPYGMCEDFRVRFSLASPNSSHFSLQLVTKHNDEAQEDLASLFGDTLRSVHNK